MKPSEADFESLIHMLRNAETLNITIEVGTIQRDNYETGFVEHQPTNGRTVTIEINGGAHHDKGWS